MREWYSELICTRDADIPFERLVTISSNESFCFVMQRISIAIQIAAASEIRQALGMSPALSSAA